jgi:hypothetical protein
MNLLRPVPAALLCLCLAAPLAWSQPTPPAVAGMVKRVAGVVTLERAGAGTPVVTGATLRVGDTLRTGADGAVGITMADDTLLTLGADSELVLSEYDFDSTTHDGSMLASLWRGTVAVVTGLIGKKTPEKLRVQTRTVVLGVRGTEFIVDAGKVAR